MSTVTEVLFPSPCYIVVAGGTSSLEGQRLTDGEGYVTISLPDAWQLLVTREKSLSGAPVTLFRLLTLLTTEARRSLNDFPSANEWPAFIEPGPKVSLRVPNSKLGIAISPPVIHPPLVMSYRFVTSMRYGLFVA